MRLSKPLEDRNILSEQLSKLTAAPCARALVGILSHLAVVASLFMSCLIGA
jgi:hypothetical protein